ncbi:unnamed protein product [Strongylus vulgaris]|uniref:Uncharacterized protein n=1 Tax=Strongylus vulgaris TaxID=40348 RepID=A0A3P7JUL9_STRVU|nr:unnamed protein product [Strongylus vulgaris]
MVPHPMNEKFDQYIKNPARRRRTSIVSVVPQPQTPRTERARSGSSLLHPFQRKPVTTLGMEEAARVNSKPRSSTDIGDGRQRSASYLNPTFLIETSEMEAASQATTNRHLHVGE